MNDLLSEAMEVNRKRPTNPRAALVRDERGRFLPRDKEIRAMTLIVRALNQIDEAAQQRIMRWALDRWHD